MGQVAKVGLYVGVILGVRFVESAILCAIEGIDSWTFLNAWTAISVSVVSLAGYGLALGLLKTRRVWVTGLTSGFLACLISVPYLFRPHTPVMAWWGLAYAMVEWFLAGVAAHALLQYASPKIDAARKRSPLWTDT